ncbi:MAG: hypothetical protein K6E51_00835 [Treponema sp.]|nr:hypothetical protein [Treponema sp.]
MKKLVYLIYLLNFGLYYPMSVYSKVLRVIADFFFLNLLKLFPSNEQRIERFNSWEDMKGVLNEEVDNWRWYICLDVLILMTICIDTLLISGSTTFSGISLCLSFAMKLYLFDYKDKRKKMFSEIKRKSRAQKLVLMFVSYFIVIMCWYLVIKFRDYLPIDVRSFFS